MDFLIYLPVELMKALLTMMFLSSLISGTNKKIQPSI